MPRRKILGRDLRPLLVMGLLALAPGCGQDATPDGGAASDETEPASPAAAAEAGETAEPGLPAGGLEAWVEEMRTRLEEIELDPRASYRDVVALYTTHHGAIERNYGEGGAVTGDEHPEIADAVQRQDSAFQELLDLTGTTDYIERTHLLHAIRNVRLAMESVLDRAREADVPLDPRSVETGGRDAR